MSEYDLNRDRDRSIDKNQGLGPIARYEREMYGGETLEYNHDDSPLLSLEEILEGNAEFYRRFGGKLESVEDESSLVADLPEVESLTPVEKLGEAVSRGAKALPAALAEELKALFSPATLASLVVVAGVYIAAHATGIGQAMDIGMLIAGGIFFGLDAFTIFKDLAGFAGAINATTEEELDSAGEHLASAIAKIGVDAVMTLLTRKVADEIGKSADRPNQVDEVTASSENADIDQVNGIENVNRISSADITPTATNNIESKYPEGININTNLPNHLTMIDGFKQQKGVSGAHNLDAFNQAVLQYKLKIVKKDKHPTIEGIYHIEYQVPKKNKQGQYTGDYRTPTTPLVKTVYDSDIISDDKILEWGQQAAAQDLDDAIANGLDRFTTTFNGIDFRVYIDLNTKTVRNVYPEMTNIQQ